MNPRRVLMIAVAAVIAVCAQTVLATTQRLHVASGGRFLVLDNGTPFFWMGDTNWRLYKLNRSEVDEYLNDRRAKQFNVIQGPVLLPGDGGSEFTNAYGETSTDPDHPNNAWFNHIDYIVDAANARNLFVALAVTWGDQWNRFDSLSSARSFGRWLGQRYANRTNVIWIVAGEYATDGFDSAIMNRWAAIGQGLKDGSGGQQLVTVHGSYQDGAQSSSIVFQNAWWLDFNMIQSSQSGDYGPGSDNWNLVRTDWRMSPHKPTIDAEPNYENFWGWDAFGVRRRAYWSVFAGAMGHTYGANGVWNAFESGDESQGGSSDHWTVALDYAGAYDMRYLRRLIESRPMLHRTAANNAVTAGNTDGTTHIQSAKDSLGRWMMVYVPERNRTFTVDLRKLSGTTARAWWFNPQNGAATLLGNYTINGPRTFHTPNSGQDWVLVLDDKSRGYSTPGTGGPLP